MLLFAQITHLTKLLQFIVAKYFTPLTSILIVYNATWIQRAPLQQEYLEATTTALQQLNAEGNLIGLQWLEVGQFDESEFEMRMLQAVNMTVTEGFVTILPNTTKFLHARYFATRNANLRLKDKLYLFLCAEYEYPEELLSVDILQFYPHHLMIRPAIKLTGAQEVAKPKTLQQLEKFAPHRDINFEMWTQKFVGAFGSNLNAVLLNAFLPNETFTKNKNGNNAKDNNANVGDEQNEIENEKEKDTVELYPNKLQNLEGRTLRMGSVTYVPYTITNYVAAGTGNTDPINPNSPNRSIAYFGSEATIMKTFCQLHNCHLRVEAYGADNWGTIYENGSSDGCLGDVYKQRIEMAIGCIYNWYDSLTEISHTIARSAVTLLGPAPAQFPAWRTCILPFDASIWLLLVGTLLLCTFILYILKYSSHLLHQLNGEPTKNFVHLPKLAKSLLDTYALFIQQPSAPTTFQRFATRFFLTTLLGATITLENIYSGQLKSLLTVPIYTEPVDSIAKWAHTNWKWAAPSSIWALTVESSDLLNEQILSRNFEVRDYDFMYNASFLPDYGLGIERLSSGTYSIGNYITRNALQSRIVLKDDLYFDWTRAVSIRGWPLMKALNKHIRTCTEFGLYEHWETEAVAQYLDKKTEDIMIDLGIGHTPKAPPQVLGIRHISGALFVLGFGSVIATIIFLLELFATGLKHFIAHMLHRRAKESM